MMTADEASGLIVNDDKITQNTTWAAGDSPVIIENNLTVSAGALLTIDPGVDVRIAEDCWIDVKGRMEAIGTDGSHIDFAGSGETQFHRINISGGGSAVMEYCDVNSSQAIGIQDSMSSLRIYNSTLETGYSGLYTTTGAQVWAINCTFLTDRNVTMAGGTIHEGNWFNLKAIKDTNGNPVKGVDLIVGATIPSPPPDPGMSYTIYDSINSPSTDPPTGADGTIRPIPVEQYIHENGVSSTRAIIRIKLNDTSRTKTIYPVYMGSDLNYLWEMDFSPPPPPSNLTVLDKGGHYIKIGWDYEGDAEQVKYFTISYKKWWETQEEDWDIQEPGRSARDWNITTENPPNEQPGLLEEMEYDIKISCVDGADNPSVELGPIRVKTLDVTPPDAPEDLDLVDVGGHFAVMNWTHSTAEDVIGYDIFVNGTGSGMQPLSFVPKTGDDEQVYNLTGLMNQTSYSFWIAARDDGEIPNLSELTGPLSFSTLDITPPLAPTLSLELVDPEQYIAGSGYYNNTQIGLRGMVPGENRTFIDVFVDGEPYVNPNPDLPRPASFEGEFFFFIHISEGEHTIEVRAEDPAGNLGPLSEEKTIHIDITRPQLGFEIPTEGLFEINTNTPLYLGDNITDDNEVERVLWNISDEDGFLMIEDQILERSFDAGKYIVKLHVWDIAGNMNSTSFTVNSTVPDFTLPELEVLLPEKSVDLDHAPVFKIRSTEALQWDLLDAAVFSEDRTERIELLGEVDEENLTVTYQLTDSLEGGKNYSLEIRSVLDLRGNKGENLVFAFDTIEDNRIDSDSDGIPDYFEAQMAFLNPSDPSDALLDSDEDGLSNIEEWEIGSDMLAKDTDEDGMDDEWEYSNGLSPTDKGDAIIDSDKDGYSNLEEYDAGTDPNDPDSKPTVDDSTDLVPIIIGAVFVIILIVVIAVIFTIYSRKKAARDEEEDREYEEMESPSPAWSEQEEEKSSECPSCGATVEEGLDYCPMCGEVISGEDVDSGSIEEPVDEEAEMDEESLEEGSIPGESPLMEDEPVKAEAPISDQEPPEIQDDMEEKEPPAI